MALFRGLPDTVGATIPTDSLPRRGGNAAKGGKGGGWNASRIVDDTTLGNAALYNLGSGVGGEGGEAEFGEEIAVAMETVGWRKRRGSGGRVQRVQRGK